MRVLEPVLRVRPSGTRPTAPTPRLLTAVKLGQDRAEIDSVVPGSDARPASTGVDVDPSGSDLTVTTMFVRRRSIHELIGRDHPSPARAPRGSPGAPLGLPGGHALKELDVARNGPLPDPTRSTPVSRANTMAWASRMAPGAAASASSRSELAASAPRYRPDGTRRSP